MKTIPLNTIRLLSFYYFSNLLLGCLTTAGTSPAGRAVAEAFNSLENFLMSRLVGTMNNINQPNPRKGLILFYHQKLLTLT